jgi:hypothetical protein
MRAPRLHGFVPELRHQRLPEGGVVMRYAISVTISQREEDEDRDAVITSMLAGDLDLMDEDMTLGGFAALDVEDQRQAARDYMGEEWACLWYYGAMEQGIDRDSRQLFDTRAEAEDIARQCRFFDDSFYEVVEVDA